MASAIAAPASILIFEPKQVTDDGLGDFDGGMPAPFSWVGPRSLKKETWENEIKGNKSVAMVSGHREIKAFMDNSFIVNVLGSGGEDRQVGALIVQGHAFVASDGHRSPVSPDMKALNLESVVVLLIPTTLEIQFPLVEEFS